MRAENHRAARRHRRKRVDKTHAFPAQVFDHGIIMDDFVQTIHTVALRQLAMHDFYRPFDARAKSAWGYEYQSLQNAIRRLRTNGRRELVIAARAEKISVFC
jgi:hypothetical protein